MNNPFTILVIEDRDLHFADFMAMWESVQESLPIQITVLRSPDLETAIPLIERVDGVITDLFFPTHGDGEELPNGVKIVEHCLEIKKPVVWITSTYHHGPTTNTHSEWGRKHGLELFDCRGLGENIEGPHKPWLEALHGLIALAVGIEVGEFRIENGIIESNYFADRSWGPLDSTLNLLVDFLLSPRTKVHRTMVRAGFGQTYEL